MAELAPAHRGREHGPPVRRGGRPDGTQSRHISGQGAELVRHFGTPRATSHGVETLSYSNFGELGERRAHRRSWSFRLSPQVGAVGDGALPNRDDANGLTVVHELVDDPVGTNAQRVQPSQPSSKRIPRRGLTLEEPEGFSDRVGDWPLEVEDLPPDPAREDDSRHLLTASSLIQLPAKIGERHCLPPLHFSKSLFDGSHRRAVGEDLCGLLQRVVLVNRDQDCGRSAPPGDDHVFTEIGNAIDEARQLAS